MLASLVVAAPHHRHALARRHAELVAAARAGAAHDVGGAAVGLAQALLHAAQVRLARLEVP